MQRFIITAVAVIAAGAVLNDAEAAPRRPSPKLGKGKGEAVSETEEFILISTEAKWFRNNRMTGKGVPELEAAAAAGDEFLVDYVRVYDIVE